MDIWEMSSLQVVYVGGDTLFAVQSEEDLKRHGCTRPMLRLRNVDEAIHSLSGVESNRSPSVLVLEGKDSASEEEEFLSWLRQHVCSPNLAVFLLRPSEEYCREEAWKYLPKTREWVQNLEEFVTARNHKALNEKVPSADGIMGELALMSAFSAEPVVLTDVRGHIEWVNDSFEKMCGYSSKELRGQKPGNVLQGPQTDSASVRLLRESVRESRPCECDIVNYTKGRKPYTVHLSLGPVVEEDQVRGFIAVETVLAPS